MAAIETTDLTKRYGDIVAVNDVSLTVEQSEIFGFLGPNGAGKSTIIDLILGFAKPSSGSVSVLGHDATTELMAVRERTGVLPEGYDLYPRLTGIEHLRFAIDSKNGSDDVDALLERVGLDPADRKRRVGEYSKGMKQRLALAMALSGDPDLLLFDEPTSGLDPSGVQRLQQIIREESKAGVTVFFSSHVLGHVETVCDRVGIMRDGRVVAVDTIEGLRNTADITDRLRLTLDEVPDVDFTSIDGIADVDIDGPIVELACLVPEAKESAVLRIADAGSGILNIQTTEASLTDLFEAYTSGESVPSDSTTTITNETRVGRSEPHRTAQTEGDI